MEVRKPLRGALNPAFSHTKPDCREPEARLLMVDFSESATISDKGGVRSRASFRRPAIFE